MSKKAQSSILSFFNKKSSLKSTTPKKEKLVNENITGKENGESKTPEKSAKKIKPAAEKPKIQKDDRKTEREIPKPEIEPESEEDIPKKRTKRKRAVIESGKD